MPKKLVSVITSTSLALSLIPVSPAVAYADEYEDEEYAVVQDEGEEQSSEEEGYAPDASAEEEPPAPDEGTDDSLEQPADDEAVVAGPLDTDATAGQPDSTLEWVDDAVDGPLTASNDYDPMPTENTTGYNPLNWDSVRTSYLHVNANGNVERVEYVGGKLLVETLSSDLSSVIGQRYVATNTFAPSNLTNADYFLWGGFFSGSQYNFVVTGQANYFEDDSLAVYRITKYKKDWTYVSHVELFGANTVYPFDAGTCFMAENGSTLHVRTCHTMYRYLDGHNHQANVHIVVNESKMSITDAEYSILNQMQTNYGYVSHSFAQRVANLNGTMYGLDLGDSYPRAVTIKKLGGYDNCTNVVPMQGNTGNEFTGVTVGGFEGSSTRGKLLSSGVTIDQSKFASSNYDTPRNAYISVTNTALTSSSVKLLTSYSSSGRVGAGLPKLVKINDDRFLVIWAEVNQYNYDYNLRTAQTGKIGYVFVDGNGNTVGSVRSGSALLSKCDPIVVGDYAIWYAQDLGGSNAPRYYGINISTGELRRVDLRQMSNVKASSIAQQTFTGNALKPKLTLTYNDNALVAGTDYTIVSYASNTNVGTASIKVEGKGRYTGTKTVNFKIVPADISKVTIAGLGNYAYTGKAITPSLALSFNSIQLADKTDYTAASKNNVNLGTATVTITGKGNFQGTRTATFGIVRGVDMHRLYNPYSGEHFYTASDAERAALVKIGWIYEGIGWKTPVESDTPVYRLYNPYAGDHHYTMSATERDALTKAGWTYEGIGWYSDDAKSVPLYRQYNPNATTGTHNYTTSLQENNALVNKYGWKAEGIGWYGVR